MNTDQKHWWPIGRPTVLIFLGIVSIAIFTTVVLLKGQSATPPFTLVSPTEDQVFRPGDPINIVVAAAPGVTIQDLLVFTRTPVPDTHGLSVTIIAPQKVGPMNMSVVAIFANGDKEGVERTVYIEPSITPVAISVEPSPLDLVAPGIAAFGIAQTQIQVTAQYPSASSLDVTHSSLTAYNSSNLRVVSIDSTGLVQAVAPGLAQIVVTAAGVNAIVPVTVNVFELRGDLDGDNDVDQSDLNILLKALNTASTGPGDPRDLNNDGAINALDARTLTNLCSRERCAVQ